jgi:GT2 family glycosyltransferase
VFCCATKFLSCSARLDSSILIKMIPLSDMAIVIPVFNQLHYTRQCVDSLNRAGVADTQIIVINNASTDGTAEFLSTRPQIQSVNNETNIGCGPAWTQGAKLSNAEWTVVLNNDVLIPVGCLEGLVDFAIENKYDVVCPAMCEGAADYDWEIHAAEFMRNMRDIHRHGAGHGVCFLVHRRVFEQIGYFNNYGGYEDDDFFRRVRQSGFRLATTGRSWLHHFGSITQKAIKSGQGRPAGWGDRAYYRSQTGQTWLKRKATQMRNNIRAAWWRHSERRRCGHTLIEQRVADSVRYC